MKDKIRTSGSVETRFLIFISALFFAFFALLIASPALAEVKNSSTWALFISGALILVLFVRNSAKLLKASSDLTKERDHMASIFNVLTDGIVEYDSINRIILVNPKAEEIFGVKNEKLRGLDLSKEENSRLKTVYEIVTFDSSKGRQFIFEMNGEKIFLEISTASVSYTGEKKFVKILRDQTRFMELQRIKSEFISVAAHQLRTPLSAIKWALKILLDGESGDLEPSQKGFVEKAYISNDRMIELVSDLLDVSRIEEGRFGYEFKEADFKEVLGEVIRSSEIRAKERTIKLELKEIKGTPTRFTFDPQRIQIVLSNLIDNAIKYTPPGGLVSMGYRQNGAFLEVSVSDSGIGIPDNHRGRVFGKFFRADNAVKFQTEGSGLGLFIAKNIVKRHGGSMWFSSELGKGSTFYFNIPLKKEFIPADEKPLESLEAI